MSDTLDAVDMDHMARVHAGLLDAANPHDRALAYGDAHMRGKHLVVPLWAATGEGALRRAMTTAAQEAFMPEVPAEGDWVTRVQGFAASTDSPGLRRVPATQSAHSTLALVHLPASWSAAHHQEFAALVNAHQKAAAMGYTVHFTPLTEE